MPLLIAVTQLTSTSEEQMQQEQLISVSLEESVRHLLLNVQKKAGFSWRGFVSAQEAAAIKVATKS